VSDAACGAKTRFFSLFLKKSALPAAGGANPFHHAGWLQHWALIWRKKALPV
jgi:hypothetical protein